MEKKGLNFLAGLGGLWLIWQLYITGWLHTVGFLTINYATGQELFYDGTYSVTPLALFGSLVIDAIAILGSLLIVLVTGLWQVLTEFGYYLKDLFIVLKDYLDGFKSEMSKKDTVVTPVKEDEKEDENSVTVKDPVEERLNPLQVILLELKSIKEKQELLELKLQKETLDTQEIKEE